MSPNRGPFRTILSSAAILVVLLAFFGCSNDDPATPDNSFGTIEIKMPTDKIDAQWHLYGPGDSFRHGDTDLVLHSVPTGRYTIIWTSVRDWTGPMPAQRTLTANATLTLNAEYVDKAPGSNFSQIAGGIFRMGSEDRTRDVIAGPDTIRIRPEIGRDPDEGFHWVNLTRGLFLGRTEITNQEFVELGNWAITNGHATTTETSMLDALDGSVVELINFDFPDTPVDVQDGTLRLKNPAEAARPLIEVTWFGAAAYCDWLSLQEGLTRAYDHDDWTINGGDVYGAEGYRLPTEAEWEYSCRGGTLTAFSSGEITTGSCNEPALTNTGWFCGNAGGASHDVGTKEANAWGLSDMHGNVWEWCNDYYGGYEIPEINDPDDANNSEVLNNPVGPTEGTNRVMRSGRWLLSSSMCRSAARMMGAPDFQGFHIGFRVAVSQIPTQ